MQPKDALPLTTVLKPLVQGRSSLELSIFVQKWCAFVHQEIDQQCTAPPAAGVCEWEIRVQPEPRWDAKRFEALASALSRIWAQQKHGRIQTSRSRVEYGRGGWRKVVTYHQQQQQRHAQQTFQFQKKLLTRKLDLGLGAQGRVRLAFATETRTTPPDLGVRWKPTQTRHRRRISFVYGQHVSIDLTQVDLDNGQRDYDVEIEYIGSHQAPTAAALADWLGGGMLLAAWTFVPEPRVALPTPPQRLIPIAPDSPQVIYEPTSPIPDYEDEMLLYASAVPLAMAPPVYLSDKQSDTDEYFPTDWPTVCRPRADTASKRQKPARVSPPTPLGLPVTPVDMDQDLPATPPGYYAPPASPDDSPPPPIIPLIT